MRRVFLIDVKMYNKLCSLLGSVHFIYLIKAPLKACHPERREESGITAPM